MPSLRVAGVTIWSPPSQASRSPSMSSLARLLCLPSDTIAAFGSATASRQPRAAALTNALTASGFACRKAGLARNALPYTSRPLSA